MYYSKAYIKTLKEIPQDAEVSSHQLMIRSGMIKKVSTGVYAWLPLGLRVLEKIKTIIRTELSEKDCNELLLPVLLPSTPWKETGRWEEYGQEMFKLTDRGQREFCLGPTHEEIITEVAKNNLRSYRDLPAFLYQIQTKFRDEPRPRFGVIRCKEFIMKDLYSFHANEECLHKGYQKISEAYRTIFTKCGLRFYTVDADNGTIGGSFSHEYVSESEVGETEFVLCEACGYTATIEVAPTVTIDPPQQTISSLEKEEVKTPHVKTVEEVSAFFHQPTDRILKTVLYTDTEGHFYLVVVRGCDEVNETKLKKLLNKDLVLASNHSYPSGYLGPFPADSIDIFADTLATKIQDGIAGAMKEDAHFQHVAYERDWTASVIGDIRSVNPGDPCPNCKQPLKVKHGMEVGHTFVLNDRYTKPLNAMYTDPDGKLEQILMGCYGIGVTRLVAAIIEQYHDEKGIQWPITVTPYHIGIVVVNPEQEEDLKIAQRLADTFENEGFEVLIDDRTVSPGFKFKDADLLGIPHTIVCGRGLKQGLVEHNNRTRNAKEELPLTEIVQKVTKEIEEELHALYNGADTGL